MADDSVVQSPERIDVPPSIDVDAIEQASKPTTWGAYKNHRALYVSSDRLARVVSAIAVVMLVVGAFRWAYEAAARFGVSTFARSDAFRVFQLAVAIAGIAATVVAIVYLTFFTVTGRIWRRWNEVTIVFGVLAGSWTILWWFDRLTA